MIMTGTLVSGTLADAFGRKPILTINVLLIFITWFMLYFANSFILLMISRIVSGFAIGIVTTVGYIFLSEIALVCDTKAQFSHSQVTLYSR